MMSSLIGSDAVEFITDHLFADPQRASCTGSEADRGLVGAGENRLGRKGERRRGRQ